MQLINQAKSVKTAVENIKQTSKDFIGKKIDEIRGTRSVALSKLSIYYKLLCGNCRDKTRAEYCDECEAKYNRAKSAKCHNASKRKKIICTPELSETNQNQIVLTIPERGVSIPAAV